MSYGSVVVKVGGSLLDLPDLGPRLAAWLGERHDGPLLLVPGGGPTADVVRQLDRRHHLGEEAAHWLALRAMTVNAWVLAALVHRRELRVAGGPEEWQKAWGRGQIPVLDAHAFARADEGRPGCLPHFWAVTSDSVAARVAMAAGAARLVLLKSAPWPEGWTWQQAREAGYVDAYFQVAANGLPAVEAVDFRAWKFGRKKAQNSQEKTRTTRRMG